MILIGAARAMRMADFEAVACLDGADSSMITCRSKLRVAGTFQGPASNCLDSPRGAPRSSHSDDKALTEAFTPELADADYKQRVELAAWTMMTHSLLNLELAKVKR